MAGGKGDRLVIGCLRIAGVRHADRRDVHGRSAIHHVADATLSRVAAGKLMALKDPLFRIEQSLDQHRLALQFRHPARRPGDLAHHAGSHVPGIKVTLDVVVDRHDAERHQRIVGDDAAAADTAVTGRFALLHPVPFGIERRHPAIALANFCGGEFFDRRPDGVAVSDAKEKRPDPSPKGEPCSIICH
ncbi:hypothetical protein D9M70_552060 [compost metagenome]